jgi:hypothetical protein
MSFRLRIGPFTFGRTGTRLSLWGGGTGISIPLTGKKGNTFGKISLGPLSWFFNKSSKKYKSPKKQSNNISPNSIENKSYETNAISAFSSDQMFLKKLEYYGMPWRGVQERIKEELPYDLVNRDNAAYSLVPKAMDTVFGLQNTSWKTDKRPSKSGNGYTTWIVIIKTKA